MTILLLACVQLDASADLDAPSDDDAADTDTAANDSGDTGDSRPWIDPVDPVCPDDAVFDIEPDRAARVIAGTITWSIDFDAAAEAGGYADCTYTRVYEELVEDNVHDWLCPECEWLTTGNSLIVDGYDDCYMQIDSYDAEHLEHFGFAPVGVETHLFRAGKPWVRARDLATVEPAAEFAVGWSDEGTMDADGATFLLTAEGTLTMAESADVVLTDPRIARSAAYACGEWPLCSPGGDVPTWTLTTGEIFPNVRLRDQCDESVDIWDFAGRWLVIEASSPDCGPCQAMADASEAWRADMESRGYNVEVITLLNASLSSINLPADLAARQDWAETFDETGPVLADQGFGYATMPAYLGKESGMSFPSVIVVGPDLKVRGGHSGYSQNEGFADIEALITAG